MEGFISFYSSTLWSIMVGKAWCQELEAELATLSHCSASSVLSVQSRTSAHGIVLPMVKWHLLILINIIKIIPPR